jgi:hypothetical protein
LDEIFININYYLLLKILVIKIIIFYILIIK